jgi:hypothetical protein
MCESCNHTFDPSSRAREWLMPEGFEKETGIDIVNTKTKY